MNTKHSSLLVFALLTTLATAGAAGLTNAALDLVSAQAEVNERSSTLTPMAPDVLRTGGRPLDLSAEDPVRVRVAAKEDVFLRCDGGMRTGRPIGGVAEFRGVPTAGCAVAVGANARPFELLYPGDRVDCRAEEGRTVCAGGIADRSAARVRLEAYAPGSFEVDGDAVAGEVHLRPGRHLVRYTPAEGPVHHWNLETQAFEEIVVRFRPAELVALAEPAR